MLANALDFLNGGLDVLLVRGATARDAKIGITSIQTSIELLLKYRLVNESGLSSIIRGDLPRGSLVDSSVSRSFRTISFNQGLTQIRQHESLTEIEEELFQRIQILRNSLVHFAANVDVEEAQMEMAWLLIRALGMFAAGEERDHGEMKTYERFLDSRNYQRLTTFEPYRAEAVDSAYDSPDSEAVFRCWVCGVNALSVRSFEAYFCHCCGLSTDTSVAGFTTCLLCSEVNGVCFDALNETRRVHQGKCLYCETVVGVVVCTICGNACSQAEGLAAGSCAVCEETSTA